MKEKKRVLLGMSGGVDSTAAALLLQRQGYEVVGATLRLQDEATEADGKFEQDLSDAREAAARLGIRHLVVDWRAQFRERVLDRFAQEYDQGRTPNPCVTCNRLVKFPSLLETADREGAAYIATGHYSIVEYDEAMGRYRLRRARNLAKDQSYVLYALRQEWLTRLLLPLGGYDKEAVRALASEAGLQVASKGDSQDICFVPDGDYTAFLERYTEKTPPAGEFVDMQGNVLGRHRGIWHYTIGQRKGLGISLGAPAFVQSIDAARHQVVLGGNDTLFVASLRAADLHWTDRDGLDGPAELAVKIRYAHTPAPAVVYPEEGGVRVAFREPQRAVTPGQAVVFYDGEYVAGGGTIQE